MTETRYKWQYKCPCGCGKIVKESGTLDDYFIKTNAVFGSRGAEGVIVGRPKTDKKTFHFNLN